MEQMVDDIVHIGKITSRSTRMFLSAVKNVDLMIERIESILCSMDEISSRKTSCNITTHGTYQPNNATDILSKKLSRNDCSFSNSLIEQVERGPTQSNKNLVQQRCDVLSHESNKMLKKQTIADFPLKTGGPIFREPFLKDSKDIISPVEPLKPAATAIKQDNFINEKVLLSETIPIADQDTDTNRDGHVVLITNSDRPRIVLNEHEIVMANPLKEESPIMMNRHNLLLSIQTGVKLKKANQENSVPSETAANVEIMLPSINKCGNFLADIRNGPKLKSVNKTDSSSKGHQGKQPQSLAEMIQARRQYVKQDSLVSECSRWTRR